MNTIYEIERATPGGGCFWRTEAVSERLPGVKFVTSGYTGRHTKNPASEEGCTDHSGHAEVVQFKFEPIVISYEKLLEVFWQAQDPTTLSRQDADTGT